MKKKIAALLLAMVGGAMSCSAMAGVDLEAMLKRSKFGEIQISPDGQYLAATMPQDASFRFVLHHRVHAREGPIH
jgi:hypothetical protein